MANEILQLTGQIMLAGPQVLAENFLLSQPFAN